jgi:hypothetical protein
MKLPRAEGILLYRRPDCEGTVKRIFRTKESTLCEARRQIAKKNWSDVDDSLIGGKDMLLMREFAEKQNLPKPFAVRLELSRLTGEEFLCMDHPVALARFVAFIKSRVKGVNASVYLRGQTTEYAGMTPALFRGANGDEGIRFAAYKKALLGLQAELPYLRFGRTNIGAVFQHYGLRTPWIDLVDNIYTAVWFATHSHDGDDPIRSSYHPSQEPYGWIYLVATVQVGAAGLVCVDLRREQSSMNVRLQVQHGLSIASQHDHADKAAMRDYGHFVVARVRIPNDRRFRLQGALATTQFYFPPQRLDESFDLLVRSRANEILAAIEAENNIGAVLGRVRRVSYRRRRGST